MKKLLLPIVVLALSACNSVGGISIVDKPKNDNTTSLTEWESNGFSDDEAKSYIEKGVLSPNEVKMWMPIIDEADRKSSTGVAASIRFYKQHNLSIDDVSKVVPSYFRFFEVDRVNYVLNLYKNGQSIQDAITRYKNHKQEVRIKYQNDYYGSDVIQKCNGVPGGLDLAKFKYSPSFSPYDEKGKCYGMVLGAVSQWLGENAALLFENRLYLEGDTPLKLGVDAVVIGEKPYKYVTVLGAENTIPSYRVIRYYDRKNTQLESDPVTGEWIVKQVEP